MILEGTTASGAVVPVQVTGDGKVVAEGLQGPQGPEGPEGPEGPPGPAGGQWTLNGTALHPTDDLAEIETPNPIHFADQLAEYASLDGVPDGSSGGRLSLSTTANGSPTPAERMRIDNLGLTTIFAATGASGTAPLTASTAYAGQNGSRRIIIGKHSATNVGDGTECFMVLDNGDVQNTNNSYAAISDIKLKENIVDAKSQWDDIKALRLVNYNFKAETGNQTHKQLGLIAQEVEKVCPGLVGETKDTETVEVPVLDDKGVAKPRTTYMERETGEVTKSVAYSVLYMKAVGALQEAMTRIEKLEAIVSANK